jgi:sulfite exporter TauE/SafE
MDLAIAAILFGFLGSFHCIGMCGPIALSLPVHNKTKSEKIIAILSYNIGRTITYSLFGILFGMIGQTFSLFGYQQALSITIGVLILLVLVFSNFLSRVKLPKGISNLLNALKEKIVAQFKKHHIRSLFSIGLLNGLLPCGLVYGAVSVAVASGSVRQATIFMALFGLGTLPLMFGITYSSHLFGTKVRSVIRRSVPIAVGITAVLLILRGLNLGISYVSPKLSTEISKTNTECKGNMECCDHK